MAFFCMLSTAFQYHSLFHISLQCHHIAMQLRASFLPLTHSEPCSLSISVSLQGCGLMLDHVAAHEAIINDGYSYSMSKRDPSTLPAGAPCLRDLEALALYCYITSIDGEHSNTIFLFGPGLCTRATITTVPSSRQNLSRRSSHG